MVKRLIEIVAGDNPSITIPVVDGDGVPMDLHLATCAFVVREFPAAVPELMRRSGAEITASAAGIVVVTLDTAETALLEPGTYAFALRVTLGSAVTTVCEGDFVVRTDTARVVTP